MKGPRLDPDRTDRWPDPAAVEAEYAKDRWNANALGIPAPRGRESVRFSSIGQAWLRQAVKDWCRWRLATGCAWGTITASATTMDRFSAFLAACEPDAADGSVISRLLLERYFSWLVATGLAASSRSLALICLRGFLEHNRRHQWLAEIPAEAAIYQDDLPRRDNPLPRFVSEFVMAQLETEGHLAVLGPAIRHLVIVLMETGLRAGDACTLPFNPLIDDSVGWPCLCFYNNKSRSDQLVPLSGTGGDGHQRSASPCPCHMAGREPLAVPRPEEQSRRQPAVPLLDPQTSVDHLAGPHRAARRNRGCGPGQLPPVPPHRRDKTHQRWGSSACRAAPTRPRQSPHDLRVRPAV